MNIFYRLDPYEVRNFSYFFNNRKDSEVDNATLRRICRSVLPHIVSPREGTCSPSSQAFDVFLCPDARIESSGC